MPHLRTQDMRAGEPEAASTEVTTSELADEQTGRGRFGMLRRGRGETSTQTESPTPAAETDAGLSGMPAGDRPRRDTGSIPGIPVPPRRSENLAGETPAEGPAQEDKPAEEQSGRFGRFMRRPGREATSDTPPAASPAASAAESAAHEAAPAEKRERLLPFGRNRAEQPADTDSSREKSIRDRMSPFGRRPLSGAGDGNDKPTDRPKEEPAKPAEDQEKPGIEGVAAAAALGAAGWLSQRADESPTDAERPRPFDRPDRSRSPLSEPLSKPLDKIEETTTPADGDIAPRPRPFDRMDRPRSPLSEPPIRAEETPPPADGDLAPRPRPFDRMDRPRSPLSEPPIRAEETPSPADGDLAPRPRPFDRMDRPRSPLSEPLSEPPAKAAEPEDAAPPAPAQAASTPPAELKPAQPAEPVEPPAQPARPAFLFSRPDEGMPVRRPPTTETKAAEPDAPEKPDEDAPVNLPPARPRGLGALGQSPFARPLPTESTRESKPVPPPDAEKPSEPDVATARAEIPTVEAPPFEKSVQTSAGTPAREDAHPVTTESGTVKAAPLAEDLEKTAPAADVPAAAPAAAPAPAPVASDPAAPRRYLPGAQGTPPSGNVPGAASPLPRPMAGAPAPAQPSRTGPQPAGSQPAGTLPPRPASPTRAELSPPMAPPTARPAHRPRRRLRRGPRRRIRRSSRRMGVRAENRPLPSQRVRTRPNLALIRRRRASSNRPISQPCCARAKNSTSTTKFLLDKARVIEDTLMSFGAPGKVVEVNPGPVITQFGVEPDYLESRGGKSTRVKVGSIARLDADLALALAAKSIRIEAPVPGKGYVGIEVPNDEIALVGLLRHHGVARIQADRLQAADRARAGRGWLARRRRPDRHAAPADRRDDRLR